MNEYPNRQHDPPPLPPTTQKSAAHAGAAHLQSRMLWLGWCLWLLISWAINLALDGHASAPTLRWTLLAAMAGLGLAWPLWRLSVARPTSPTISTITDLCFMLSVFQVLVVRLAIDLPFEFAMLVNAVMITFGLAIGMCVDIGRRLGAMGRTGAMLVCVAIPIVPGLVLWDMRSPLTVALSPIHGIWVLCKRSSVVDVPMVSGYLLVSAVMIICLWVLGVLWVRRGAG